MKAQKEIYGVCVSVFLALGAFYLTSCSGGANNSGSQGQGFAGMPPMPVTVEEVRMQSMVHDKSYPARVFGMREVEVRARVGGILEQRLYEEGVEVVAGQALFQIEAEPYVIALRQAEADLSNAKAAFQQAQREWKRNSELFDRGAISERERDAALSAFELAEARIALADARVDEARLHLDYTTVVAPIPGYTGMEHVSEGSLVERGSLLTTLVQHDPVQVRFSIPEAEALLWKRGGGSRKVIIENGAQFLEGTLDFAGSSIDPRTGSVALRALVANEADQLIPGQFVRVRVVLAEFEDIVALDSRVISQGAEGLRVFVLGPDNTALERTVKPGLKAGGKQIILEGLQEGDLLIVNGHVALRNGAPVMPVNL